MGNILSPLVDSIWEVIILLPKAWDSWGNIVYRLVEGKKFEEDGSKQLEKVKYNFIPIEGFLCDYKLGNKVYYEYVEGGKNSLKVCVGIDINGKYVWVDLLNNNHLLVAGASRWGKSNVINCILIGLMKNYTPNEVQFVLCDYKKNDVYMFEDCPHVVKNYCSYNDQGLERQLDWLNDEASKRADIIRKANKKNFIKYNEVATDKLIPIIFIIDELVQVCDNDKLKKKLHKVMSLVGSYGIYFIIASQDCTKEVVGRVKMNISQTIGLHTRDKNDSDMVIKNGNLEDINIKGRCKIDAEGELVEFQSFYMEDEEVEAYINEFKNSVN